MVGIVDIDGDGSRPGSADPGAAVIEVSNVNRAGWGRSIRRRARGRIGWCVDWILRTQSGLSVDGRENASTSFVASPQTLPSKKSVDEKVQAVVAPKEVSLQMVTSSSARATPPRVTLASVER